MYRVIVFTPEEGNRNQWFANRRTAMSFAKRQPNDPETSVEVCKVRDRNDTGGIIIWREPIGR